MITGLRLDNFRGFVTTQDLTFGKINLFYGPNSGGKSTVLRSLSLLKQSFAHNEVDNSCILLPYSRDGVDMGSPTSLHHNLDASVPFSLSLASATGVPFRISRSKRLAYRWASDTAGAEATSGHKARRGSKTSAHSRVGTRLHWSDEDEKVFFDDPSPAWHFAVTIAEGEDGSQSALHKVHFGNQHFMAYCSRTEPSTNHLKLFLEHLREASFTLPAGREFQVLDATWDTAMQRRTKRPTGGAQDRETLRDFTFIHDASEATNYFAVDDIIFGSAYEEALASYLVDYCEQISAFATAVASDMSMLGYGKPLTRIEEALQAAFKTQPIRNPPPSQLTAFAGTLCDYFESVAAFFSNHPTPAGCLQWWKDDLKRSRFVLFGYRQVAYDGSGIPPLAQWMMTAWWTGWRRKRVKDLLDLSAKKSWIDSSQAKRAVDSQYAASWQECDEVDDIASVYVAAVRSATSSLRALRDIGPDRSSAERVYRVEPRQQVARDYVGRRATEIPRLLYESPGLLDELNRWLRQVDVPYRLIVDPLEIRGGGGMDVRQTGLFELNAELSHTLNARINLSDVGHGLFKQLALPIQVFLGRNFIITIEEPETNVHPRLQAEIADLFIDAVLNRGHQIFAEAHSEILSLRLRRRIAEGQIPHQDVRLFYVHAHDNGPCVVLPLELDGKGYLKNEPPGGFFDEWLNEV